MGAERHGDAVAQVGADPLQSPCHPVRGKPAVVTRQHGKAAGGNGVEHLACGRAQPQRQQRGYVLQQALYRSHAHRSRELIGARHVDAVYQHQPARRTVPRRRQILQVADEALAVGQAGDRVGKAGGVPGLQKRHHQRGQQLQGGNLPGAKRVWGSVRDAQCAEHDAFAVLQRYAGIEADVGRARDERVRDEAGVQPGVGHHHRAVVVHRVTTE